MYWHCCFGPCGTDCKAVISYAHILHKPAWKLLYSSVVFTISPIFFLVCDFSFSSPLSTFMLYNAKGWLPPSSEKNGRDSRLDTKKDAFQWGSNVKGFFFCCCCFLYISIISDNKSTYSSSHLKSTCRTVAHLCFRNIKHNRWVNHYLLWVVSSCTFILSY